MRLINTSTLLLDEFYGEDIPKYAILSHTWTKEEVTLREWQKPTATTTCKAGFLKVKDACAVTLSLAHEWLWADTVCIDKTSSAELSEAINSMYAWYRDSAQCLVYLADVEPLVGGGTQLQDRITASRWFTRGWTLQELLAPTELTFYDRQWGRLGTKSEYANAISHVTGVPSCIIEDSWIRRPDAGGPSVAQRMSWIARRRTTRVEDMAYCMLGIFDINMPLLYGEGAKAFLRLQHEILSTYHDHTILAWTWTSPYETRERKPARFGVLARSPTAFTDMDRVVRASIWNRGFASEKPAPYSLTNLGLSIRLSTFNMSLGHIAILDAHGDPTQYPNCHCLAIPLRSVVGPGQHTWSRSAYPSCALRFCTRLPIPRSVGLFLATQADDHRHQGLCPPAPLEECVFSATPDRYGLLLISQHASPGLGSHPPSCLDASKSLLNFPSNPTSWKEMSSASGHPHLHVRSAAVVLCVWRDMSNDCFGIPEFGIFDRPDLSIVFTLSIVTVKGTDEPKRFAVFGDGVQIPNDWHPDPRAKWKQDRGSEPDKEEALNHDPVAGGVVNAEMQRIFDAVTSEGDEIEDCLRYWNEKHSGYFAVQVGRCDVGYPGFTETRMALINLRLSDLNGGDEDDYHMSLSLSGSVEA